MDINRLRKVSFVGVVFVLVFVVSFVLYNESYRTTSRIAPATTSVGTGAMQFEIATTTKAQEKGLGGRTNIPNNYGMLFVFKTSGKYGFWMKDMMTSIDIIWLSDKGVVLGVEKSISPSTYPNVFYPPEPVRYVLETRAGVASKRGWSVGVLIPLPKSVR